MVTTKPQDFNDEYFIVPEYEPDLKAMEKISLDDSGIETPDYSDSNVELLDAPELSDVFVCDPEAEQGEKQVRFGMKLETNQESDYIRHLAIDVEPGSLAKGFAIRYFYYNIPIQSMTLLSHITSWYIYIYTSIQDVPDTYSTYTMDTYVVHKFYNDKTEYQIATLHHTADYKSTKVKANAMANKI